MTKRVRALFFRPGEREDAHEPAANVWIHLDASEGTAALLHCYGADLAPAAGWEIDAGADGRFEVRSVAGGTAHVPVQMTLAKIGGAA